MTGLHVVQFTVKRQFTGGLDSFTSHDTDTVLLSGSSVIVADLSHLTPVNT